MLEPDAVARPVPLPDDGELVIGRADGAAIRLGDGSVSRAHARLACVAGGVRVVDLGSHNGVLVNGERVAGDRVLRPRDVVAVGRTTLVYYRPEPAPVAAREPTIALPPLPLHRGPTFVAEPRMVAMYRRVESLAACELTVVVTGETGTGKELVAQALHAWSARRAGPFVTLNCAALPDALAESELFGHERGAFSGATAEKPGLLETAAGGTVFLDEIGEMSLANQSRLLRALDIRRATRVGGVRERVLDFRLIAATNRDLEAEVVAERFRSDLFFRLGGAVVTVPPLRDRATELPGLAHALLADACARAGRPPRTLSAAALSMLQAYAWPGNVRELRHLVELLATSPDRREVEPGDLPDRLRAAAVVAPCQGRRFGDEVRALERARMADALDKTFGNQTRAAALIGMPRRTFVEKLRQYGLRKTR